LVSYLAASGLDVAEDGVDIAAVVVVSSAFESAMTVVERAVARERPIVVLLRRDVTRDGAWRLVEAGAADVLPWGEPARTAARIAARIDRWCAVDELVASRPVREGLVGGGTGWARIVRTLVETAAFTDVPLLITGETGTGKELAARLVHQLDRRSDKRDLVVVDCTTIVPTLSGSEFFGHERGAFTGAATAREGAFGRADRGTLFLDEVAELEPQLQAELLRVVQEGMYKRVGSDAWRQTSFRLVCATNRNLTDEVEAGRFRYDLYYRIAAATVQLPPLRERCDDVLPLARHFLAEILPDTTDIDEPVRDFLRGREYPGNVRELRHLVLRMALRHVGDGPLTIGDVPEDERPTVASPPDADDALAAAVRLRLDGGATLREISPAAADAAVAVALADAGGSVPGAARRLGVTPRALQLRRAHGRLPAPLPAGLDLQPIDS
jgi:transcriptional regulator with GAF, ATPase, and Fis domain